MRSESGTPPSLGPAAVAWIEQHHGVVGRQELLQGGAPASRIDSWRRTGRLVLLHEGVYGLGHRPLTAFGRWRAAVLAGGPGTCLSHRSGAALHEALGERLPWVHVTTTRRAESQGTVVVHRTRRLESADVVVVRHVPVTSVARTLIDVAEAEGYLVAREAADRLRRLDLDLLAATLARTPGRRGHAAVSRVLARDEARTRSAMERAYLRFCARTGLPRPDRLNVWLAGCLVDAVYDEERLAVELDGRAHHQRREQMRTDRERDTRVLLAEHRPLRLVWEELTAPELEAVTVARVRALLALGRRLPGGVPD